MKVQMPQIQVSQAGNTTTQIKQEPGLETNTQQVSNDLLECFQTHF